LFSGAAGNVVLRVTPPGGAVLSGAAATAAQNMTQPGQLKQNQRNPKQKDKK
jgi:hypothetical protein